MDCPDSLGKPSYFTPTHFPVNLPLNYHCFLVNDKKATKVSHRLNCWHLHSEKQLSSVILLKMQVNPYIKVTNLHVEINMSVKI